MIASQINRSQELGMLGAFLLASCLPAFGQSEFLTCTGSAEPVAVRAGGAAERTADFVLHCTGGYYGEQQSAMPATLVLSFEESRVTSRPLAPGWSDALLVVDEPQPANQLACSTPDGQCTVLSTGSGTYDGSPGHPNVFQAEYGMDGYSLVWNNVPFDPPALGETRTFRFTNLRVSAADLPVGTEISASFYTFGEFSAEFIDTTQTVAVTQTPIAVTAAGTASSGGQISAFSVNIAEQFSNVLKAHSSAGPTASSGQSAPGGVTHAYEMGFYNPNLFTSERGALSLAGLPDNGTRVRLQLFSVPASASVSVPPTVNFGIGGVARRIIAYTDGIGPYVPAYSTYLPNDNGLVTAVYEIIRSSEKDQELLSIPFEISYSGSGTGFNTLDGTVSLAPVHPSQIADGSPIPRFYDFLGFTVIAPLAPLSITTTSLPNGATGSPYTQTITAAGGLPPYTFSSVPVSPAPGLALGSNGVLTGTPTVAGPVSFAVTVRDAKQSAVTKVFTLNIGATGSLLQTSVSKVDFASVLGGGNPPLQTIAVMSSLTGQVFSINLDGGLRAAAPAWLQVTPSVVTAPALVTISVNQAGLAEGTYSAQLQISSPNNPGLTPVVIPITLTVKAVPAKLESSASALNFAARAANPGTRQQTITLRNSGGGGAIPFTAAVQDRSPWITSVSPASGTAGATGTSVNVDVNTAGLAEGIYRDVVRFTAASTTVEVPIILTIAPSGALLDLDRRGVLFSMRQGVWTLGVRDIKILNRDPGSSLSWSAELIRGAENFALAPASGTAKLTAPGSLRLAVKPAAASLPAGTYYGLVRITAPNAAYSPRYVVAVLRVKAPALPVDLDLDAGGVVISAITRSQAVSRVFPLNAATNVPLPFQAAASTIDGANWLSVTPNVGSLSATQTQSLTVTANPLNLIAGVYRGEVTIATADVSRTLAVTLFVTDAASDPLPIKGRAAACSPDSMIVSPTGLSNGFSVPAGWPATLSVDLRDKCGAPISNATVTAQFSNGDAPMTLQSDDITGVYSATWQPGAAGEQANVTLTAVSSNFPKASAFLVGSVKENKENKVPTLARGGTIHNLNYKPGGLLAPGLVAQVYGTDLATVTESTTAIPLATEYKGTSVFVGPYQAPLYFVSPGQLVVQLPYELTPNRSYDIMVITNGGITIPDQINIVAAQPGVAAFSDGKLIAQDGNYALIDATNPAMRGEALVMYLVGLGTADQMVASGVRAPSIAPLPVLTVPPVVTIDGAPVEVFYAGFTPGGIGLYQINFKVPETARLNAPLEVVVKQGTYTANTTTLTVVQ